MEYYDRDSRIRFHSGSSIHSLHIPLTGAVELCVWVEAQIKFSKKEDGMDQKF